MTREEAIESMEYSKAQAEIALSKGVSQYWKQEINWTIEAIDMAIEALEREDKMLKEIERIVLHGERRERMADRPCKFAINTSGDCWECGCFLDTYCEHQIYDRNPDGTLNIVKCGERSEE